MRRRGRREGFRHLAKRILLTGGWRARRARRRPGGSREDGALQIPWRPLLQMAGQDVVAERGAPARASTAAGATAGASAASDHEIAAEAAGAPGPAFGAAPGHAAAGGRRSGQGGPVLTGLVLAEAACPRRQGDVIGIALQQGRCVANADMGVPEGIGGCLHALDVHPVGGVSVMLAGELVAAVVPEPDAEFVIDVGHDHGTGRRGSVDGQVEKTRADPFDRLVEVVPDPGELETPDIGGANPDRTARHVEQSPVVEIDDDRMRALDAGLRTGRLDLRGDADRGAADNLGHQGPVGLDAQRGGLSARSDRLRVAVAPEQPMSRRTTANAQNLILVSSGFARSALPVLPRKDRFPADHRTCASGPAAGQIGSSQG